MCKAIFKKSLEAGKKFFRFLHFNRKIVLLWFGFNVFIAGFLCIVLGELKYCKIFGFGDKDGFYSINREAYSGYFYALSISWIAGSLFLIFRSWCRKRRAKGKVILAGVAIALLCIVAGSYVLYSERMVSMSAEKIVENIDVERIAGSAAFNRFDNKIDSIDMLADAIDTEKFFDNVDKDQLKHVLLHVKYKMEEPIPHVNWLLIVLTFLSFSVSFYTFYATFWD